MATANDSWPLPAAPPDLDETLSGSGAGARGSFRSLLLIGLAILAGAGILTLGITRLVATTQHHQSAVDRLTAIRQNVQSVRADLRSHLDATHTLRATLSAQKARISYLQGDQSRGFAATIAAASERGSTAGDAAGRRIGIHNARAQRSSANTAGWYYVRVSWKNGLPVIADSYTLDPGAEHAYWVEGGKAVTRDTLGP